MLEAGDRVPDIQVWAAPREEARPLAEVLPDPVEKSTCLLLLYGFAADTLLWVALRYLNEQKVSAMQVALEPRR